LPKHYIVSVYIWPMGFLFTWPSIWNMSPDILCDPDITRYSCKCRFKVQLFSTYWSIQHISSSTMKCYFTVLLTGTEHCVQNSQHCGAESVTRWDFQHQINRDN